MLDGDRCQGWELEELIVKAIKADTTADHLPKWHESGHDDKEDILVVVNGKSHQMQVKSGRIRSDKNKVLWLVLSGHRLGRFKVNLVDITHYLNGRTADVISVLYRQDENQQGRRHIYRLCYISIDMLKSITSSNWNKHGAQWRNSNKHGVEFSLRPSMSWQIWWQIPLSILQPAQEFSNGQFL